MNKILLGILVILAMPAQAEVFKCVLADKTVYQPDPCPSAAIKQAEIAIEKPDPIKAAQAQEKLKAWEADFAKREAADRQAEKERQAELDKKAAIDALYRTAKAQEEMADAARNPVIINRSYGYSPYYRQGGWGGYGFGFGFEMPHQHEFAQSPVPSPRPSQPLSHHSAR